MSMREWTSYGYGICMDDDRTYGAVAALCSEPEKFWEAFSKAPKTAMEMKCYIEEYADGDDIDGLDLFDAFDEYEDECGETGIGYFLALALTEISGVRFYHTSDGNGVKYVVFYEGYPWQMTEKEKSLTEDDLAKIVDDFLPGCSIYAQDIQNWG